MFEDTNIPDGIDSKRRLNKYTTNLDKQVRAAQSRLAFARKMESVLFEGEDSISKGDIHRAYFCNDTEQETFVLMARVPDDCKFIESMILDDVPPGINVFFENRPNFNGKKLVFKKTAPQ
jgi:hypothetical protein